MGKTFSLFYQSLQPTLAKVEPLRKSAVKHYYIVYGVMIAGFLFEVITWMLIGIVVIIAFTLYYIRKAQFAEKAFHQNFAPEVLKSAFEQFFRIEKFRSSKQSSQESLLKCQLFGSEIQRVEGEFELMAAYQNVQFSLSEIQILGRTQKHYLFLQCPTNLSNFLPFQDEKATDSTEAFSGFYKAMDACDCQISSLEKTLSIAFPLEEALLNKSLWKSKLPPQQYHNLYKSLARVQKCLDLLDLEELANKPDDRIAV